MLRDTGKGASEGMHFEERVFEAHHTHFIQTFKNEFSAEI